MFSAATGDILVSPYWLMENKHGELCNDVPSTATWRLREILSDACKLVVLYCDADGIEGFGAAVPALTSKVQKLSC